MALFFPPLAPDEARSGANARRGSRRDGDGAGTSRKFKFAGFEFVQVSLVLEEYDFAIRFAARLKPDAQLRHYGVADRPIMHIHLTLASGAADDEAAGADGWEYGVRITIGEKDGTLSRMLE